MSYLRLLRLPPPSETVGLSWRRKLSACARHGKGPERERTTYRRVRAHNHGLEKEEGESIVEAVGSKFVGEVDIFLVHEGATARRADASSRKQAAAVPRLQTHPGHGAKALWRSRHRPLSSLFREAAGSGWKYGWGGVVVPTQSLRAFASAPPDPAARPSHYSKSPRQRTPLRDLLKPSDVSNDHCRKVTTA